MKIPVKYKLWFLWQRILNLNFSEFTAIIVAAMLTISVAYPQLERLNKNQKTISIEFKSKTGEITSGEINIKDNKNYTLEILSLIGIVFGPLILLWKFFIEPKSIIKFYGKTIELLQKEYEELLNNPDFKNTEQNSIKRINNLFTKINDVGIVTKKELLNLKKEITPHNTRYKNCR